MGDLSSVNWGDAPTWLQALGGMAQLGHAVWAVQVQRHQVFVDRLREELGVDDDADIADQVMKRPELAGLVVQAVQDSLRARDDEKRWLLARVVAAAFAGDDARINERAIFLRTAANLEPPDVRVLVEISKARPSSFPNLPKVGSIKHDELSDQLDPDQRLLVRPIVATLVREGLVEDVALGTFGYREAWRTTQYGFAFLRYLPEPVRPALDTTTVVANFERPGPLSLRNLGPGKATVTECRVTVIDGEIDLYRSDDMPIDVEAGDACEIPLRGREVSESPSGFQIRLVWVDQKHDGHESNSIAGAIPEMS